MLRSKIISVKSRAQFKYYDRFANSNWDNVSTSKNDKLDFFDTPQYVVSLYKNKTKVSLLFVFIRSVKINTTSLKMAGIGGVVTHKQYRHKGYASLLLQKTIEFLRDKVDFSLLCTDIDRLGQLYSRCGFRPLNKNYYFINKNGVTVPESGGMVLVFKNNDDTLLIADKKITFNIGKSNI